MKTLALAALGVALVWGGSAPTVARVVDGDTLDLTNRERVRIVGIDTPERGECGYRAATEALDRLVDGRIGLNRTTGTDNRDRYGRLLRYVSDNRRDVGYNLVRYGYAEHYTRFGHVRYARYARAEQLARAGNLGLWKGCGHP